MVSNQPEFFTTTEYERRMKHGAIEISWNVSFLGRLPIAIALSQR